MPLPSYILLVKDYRKHVPGIHHLINLNNGGYVISNLLEIVTKHGTTQV
jgi:hypothetical protein